MCGSISFYLRLKRRSCSHTFSRKVTDSFRIVYPRSFDYEPWNHSQQNCRGSAREMVIINTDQHLKNTWMHGNDLLIHVHALLLLSGLAFPVGSCQDQYGYLFI